MQESSSISWDAAGSGMQDSAEHHLGNGQEEGQAAREVLASPCWTQTKPHTGNIVIQLPKNAKKSSSPGTGQRLQTEAGTSPWDAFTAV